MQLIEVATLDRKSGAGEGPAVHFTSNQSQLEAPPSPLSSCLPRRAAGAKRLADLSHKEAFIARSRRTSAMLVRRCYSELFGHKDKSHNPLSGSCPRFSTTQAENSIPPPRFALDGYGIVFSRAIIIFYHHVAGKLQTVSANKHRRGPSTSRYKPFFTTDLRGAPLRMTVLWGVKTSGWGVRNTRHHRKVTGSQNDGFFWGGLETSGVFEKATGCQEGGFVGVLKKYVPDRLALMGRSPSCQPM